MAKKVYDVIIVGAGPAGSICALTCARMGLHTLVVEADSPNRVGHTYAIEVEKTVFSKCQVPEPVGDEVTYHHRGARVYSPTNRLAFQFKYAPVVGIKLDKAVRRFVDYGKKAGVKFAFQTKAEKPILKGNRVVGVTTRCKDQATDVHAKMVVDATGNAAALTRKLSPECGIDFIDRTEDTVVAEARLYQVDENALKKAAADGRLLPDYAHHQVGFQGTYSTLSYLVLTDPAIAWLLCGIKAENAHPRPGEVLDQLAEKLGCLKRINHRGAGDIRIRRASLRLVCDGFATIGEAASMVIPLHGSGMASGMLAGSSLGVHLGRLLPQGLETSTKNLWPWCAQYQRGRGLNLAGYDAARRLMEKLDPEKETEQLFRRGLVQAEDMIRAADAQPLLPSLASLPKRALGATRLPFTLLKMSPKFPRIPLVDLHWRQFPQQWDEKAFAKWKKTAEKLLP